MNVFQYDLKDMQHVASGAALLGSGGGGSYQTIRRVLAELGEAGGYDPVEIVDYDGKSTAVVLAMMGSPDKAANLTFPDVEFSMNNTVNSFLDLCDGALDCFIPVEIGPFNSVMPLIAAAIRGNSVTRVVNGDGAGRAVPSLSQTLYGCCETLKPAPCVLANHADKPSQIQAVQLRAQRLDQLGFLAGRVVDAFGGFSGIALWLSSKSNDYALKDCYIKNTLESTRKIGKFFDSASKRSAKDVCFIVENEIGCKAVVLLEKVYITEVVRGTNASSLDSGYVRLDDKPDMASSSATYMVYFLNENMLAFSERERSVIAVAPSLISYYSEDTGQSFTNAKNDIAYYYDEANRCSTGQAVSLLKIDAQEALRAQDGICESFARVLGDLRDADGNAFYESV